MFRIFLGIALVFAAFSSDELLANKARSVVFSLPVFSFGQSTAKVEYNFRGLAGFGLEANFIDGELYGKKEAEEKNGDSIKLSGTEVGLYYAKYSKPKTISGFFWALGVGMRTVYANWARTRTDEIEANYLDENQRLRHSLVSRGNTYRARMGYRYIGSSFPINLGAYIGVRHFENRFSDNNREDNTTVTPNDDQQALQRRLMSSLEPGLELGFAF